MSSGYVYYVTVKGITGSKLTDISTIKKNVSKIKKFSQNNIPVAVGFGIKDSKSAKQMSKFSDGIIIGSSIVELVEKNKNNKALMYKKINNFLKSIKLSLVNK